MYFSPGISQTVREHLPERSPISRSTVMAVLVVLSKALLTVAILIAAVGYYVWVPLPEDLDQKGLARVMGVITRLRPVSSFIGSLFLGHKSYIDTFRGIGSLIPAPALDSDPTLQVTNDVYNGVPVRVYRPKSAPVPSPVLMYYHGGGWCIGSIDGEDVYARYMANATNMAVVSVEYRLAPEHPFPAPIDDCMTATLHVMEKGRELGFNTDRMGVYGASAGGNLAAAVSLRLLDEDFQHRNLPKLKFQALIVPSLQAVDFSLPSYIDNDVIASFVLSREQTVSFIQFHAGLGDSPATTQQIMKGQHIREKTKVQLAKYVHRDLLDGSKNKVADGEDGGTVNETLASLAEPVVGNYRFSPLLAPDDVLKRVPPAVVMMSHYDVLRDDGLLYVKRLRQVGVEVVSAMIENGHHISMMTIGGKPGSENAAKAHKTVNQFIKDHIKS